VNQAINHSFPNRNREAAALLTIQPGENRFVVLKLIHPR
jgi:hypothetical protein